MIYNQADVWLVNYRHVVDFLMVNDTMIDQKKNVFRLFADVCFSGVIAVLEDERFNSIYCINMAVVDRVRAGNRERMVFKRASNNQTKNKKGIKAVIVPATVTIFAGFVAVIHDLAAIIFYSADVKLIFFKVN